MLKTNELKNEILLVLLEYLKIERILKFKRIVVDPYGPGPTVWHTCDSWIT